MLLMSLAEPRVLLLGDSIRMGYAPYVADALDGCTVYQPSENCRHTEYSIANVDRWIAGRTFSVIHCNWGMHDVWAFNCGQWNLIPLEEYQQNLHRLFARLKRSARVVIFATTTPVPDDTPGRCNEDINKYNVAAREICNELGVEINDINEYMCENGDLEMYPPYDCHPLPEGQQLLGSHVAEVIAEQLEEHPMPLNAMPLLAVMLCLFSASIFRR
jgi:acyl-CoA thioesterase-1